MLLGSGGGGPEGSAPTPQEVWEEPPSRGTTLPHATRARGCPAHQKQSVRIMTNRNLQRVEIAMVMYLRGGQKRLARRVL